MDIPNPNGCWDWVGWYGDNADQIGGELDLFPASLRLFVSSFANCNTLSFEGAQMTALVNQVNQIITGGDA